MMAIRGMTNYEFQEETTVLQLIENDLKACLAEMASRWSEAFQHTGVKLETLLDPSIATFRFDYQKLQQAAVNLLDNALKYTPSGGTVTLRARPRFWERRVAELVPAEERRRFHLPRPNSVEVSLTDSGGGIAPEYHQKIFEDYVRVDRKTSGMGLGLAIARRLIQAHRGKIWVESEQSHGSTFVFLLPMDLRETDANAPSPQPTSAYLKKRGALERMEDKKRGAWVRKIRNALRLTQEKLAGLAGISQVGVSRYETGKQVSRITKAHITNAVFRVVAKRDPDTVKQNVQPLLEAAERFEKILGVQPGDEIALAMEKKSGKTLADMKAEAEKMANFLRVGAKHFLSLLD